MYPRTLFSASASSLLEKSDTSLSLDVEKTVISSATPSADGNDLVSDAELVALSFEDAPLPEGLKKESQRIVNSTNLHERQPVTVSDVKVNESSVIGNLSDDALSMFFQSPEVGAHRKLRRAPKQRAKRKYAPGLEFSPNVSHSLVSDSEHCAYNDEKSSAQGQEDISLCNQSSSFFQIDNSFQKSKMAVATDAAICTSLSRLPDDVPSNTDVAFSQEICVKTSGDTIKPRTSSVTDVILKNAEAAMENTILSENACVSTASSILSKTVMKTMNTILEPSSQTYDFTPSEVTTRLVSTVRPIFSRNRSKVQSPGNFQSQCVNQSFPDLASPFSILPECTSTPIRVVAKLKEQQDKNLSSADVEIVHNQHDSGSGQMNQASGSFGPNSGVRFSGVTVDCVQNASLSKHNSETSSQSLLQSLKKPKKFVYPTAAQIAKTCPKKIFSFQPKSATACGNSQNLVVENKKPDVSFYSLKQRILPTASDSSAAKESFSLHITSDARLNRISEGKSKFQFKCNNNWYLSIRYCIKRIF